MWAQSLAGIDGEEIKYGVEYCRANHKWPPTIAEFLIACKAKPKQFVSLPAPRIDPEESTKRMAKIMSGLQVKSINGRAYWRKVLDDPTTNPYTRRFAHEALAILTGGQFKISEEIQE